MGEEEQNTGERCKAHAVGSVEPNASERTRACSY